MPDVFDYHHTVAPEEIDGQGHVGNVVYVRWLQEAAVAHSAAQGWTAARYRDFGAGWVVRSHTIEYLRPARRGDAVVVRTWVATMHKASSIRRYVVLREGEPEPLARAETRWVCVDYRTGQAVRVPREIAEAFVVVERG